LGRQPPLTGSDPAVTDYVLEVPHKRLMILGTLALIPAATTRPPLHGSAVMTLAMFGLAEAIFITALILHDVRTSGRLYPATIFGGGSVLIGAVSRNWISHTDLWLAVARSPRDVSFQHLDCLATWFPTPG